MYNLKDKIEVTKEFLNDLIVKNWQEAESIQQQMANIDTSTPLGTEAVRLLKNACTNYYVLIGCLENLLETPNMEYRSTSKQIKEYTPKALDAQALPEQEPEEFLVSPVDAKQDDNFEPFEYFVDFDEPSGDPLSDDDLYGN
jgi:hypothetical protein